MGARDAACMALPAPVARPVAVVHPAGTVLLGPDLGWAARLSRRIGAALRDRWDRLWFHPAREQVLPLAGLSLISAVGTASAPALLQWPLLLVALSPRLVFLTLAAGQVHWLPFLLVATARLCVADPFHHRLGQICGASAIGRLPGPIRRWAERSVAVQRPLAAAAVLVRPNGPFLAWAGSQGLSSGVVHALALVGTVAYLLAVRAGAAALFG
jgi:hypothetical protein